MDLTYSPFTKVYLKRDVGLCLFNIGITTEKPRGFGIIVAQHKLYPAFYQVEFYQPRGIVYLWLHESEFSTDKNPGDFHYTNDVAHAIDKFCDEGQNLSLGSVYVLAKET